MTLHLEIITPERLVLEDEVDAIVAPAIDGLVGVLPHHTPFLTRLGVGELKLRKGGETSYFAVAGGFLEVSEGSRVSVFAETAQMAGEIDIERAKLEAEEMKAKLAQSADLTGEEFAAVERELTRALLEIKVAQTRVLRRPPPGMH